MRQEKKMKKQKFQMAIADRIFDVAVKLFVILLFVITLYPIIFVISASVSDPSLVSAGKMLLFPKGFTLDGYSKLLEYKEIWLGYVNTFFYTIVGTTLNLLVTLPCAYALSRDELKGRNAIMKIFAFTMYFGGGLIPSFLNVRDLGLYNTRTILLVLGLVSTYNLIVARTFFASSIPKELQESAMLDGASDFIILRKVVLPLSKSIISVLALYYGVGHWNSYFTPMVYLEDRSKFPLQVFLKEILTQTQVAMNSMSGSESTAAVIEMLQKQDTANLLKYALIIVSSLPLMIIYPFLQKHFEKGVMLGSIKG